MTTLIVDIKSGGKAEAIADALRLMKGVARVTVEDAEISERIPGLPYTDEEKRESLRLGMEDVRAGRVYTIEEVRARLSRT